MKNKYANCLPSWKLEFEGSIQEWRPGGNNVYMEREEEVKKEKKIIQERERERARKGEEEK